jgi:soluble lytic murein transglycosylase-like protein
LKRKININKGDFDTAHQEGLFRLGVSLLVIFFLACCLPGPCRADIYRYIDSEGIVHYTNTPTASGFKLYIREKTVGIKVDSVSKTYDAIIRKAQIKYGIAFSLIKAVIHAESGFNPRAVSKKGAKGLMQIMPDNYRALSVSDPFDPSQNIMGGTRYLKQLLNRYDAKLPLALAAYNAGPTVVDLYLRIPPYTETQNYVQKVMTLYNRYKNI